MRRLVVCLDGTQNRAEGPEITNVAKLYMLVQPVAQDGVPQIKYYSPGVGVYRALDKPWAIATGVGVQTNLRLAYQFICGNHTPDTELFIFGFSRGGFSARHLAGLISRAGILPPKRLAEARNAWEWYRHTVTGRPSPVAFDPSPAPVRFLGLWDAVASSRPFFWGGNKAFYGGRLEANIATIRHAVATNERRYKFRYENYQGASPQYIEKWFPGYHSDVGGGHLEAHSGLSNVVLEWMLGQASVEGLEFDPEHPWRGDPSAEMNPSDYKWTRFVNRPRSGWDAG